MWWPRLSWRMWASVAIVAAAVGVGVAAFIHERHEGSPSGGLLSGSRPATRPSSSTPTESSSSSIQAETASGGACSSQHSTSAIEVTYYGNGNMPCEEFDRAAAKGGQYWRLVGTALHVHPLCSLQQGALVLEMRFTGISEGEAEHICASSAAEGWTEVEGPGEQQERHEAQAAAEQEASAQAQWAHKRAEEEQKEEAERRKQEATEKREDAEEEARSKKELAEDERQTHEETRQSEEEAARAQRESEFEANG